MNAYEVSITFVMESETFPTTEDVRRQLASFDVAEAADVILLEENVDEIKER